jgi:hypothetical protein
MGKLPEVLLGLELQEIYGIGMRMEERFECTGIFTSPAGNALPVTPRPGRPPLASRKAWAISMCSRRRAARAGEPASAGEDKSVSISRRISDAGRAARTLSRLTAEIVASRRCAGVWLKCIPLLPVRQ